MNCRMAVKRPRVYDSYLSPGDFAMEVKRKRQVATPHSSFSPKMGSLSASLAQSSPTTVNGHNSAFVNKSLEISEGPFSLITGKCQLSGSQLETYLRAEIQYLKRRKLIPVNQSASSSTDYRVAAASPSHSDADSDGENRAGPKRKCIRQNSNDDSLYEKPQFSLKQVKLICERLLQEQEIRLRMEYGTVLNQKLEEKHEEYVQFAKEQIGCRSGESDYSYVS